MPRRRLHRLLSLSLLTAVACRPHFEPIKYTSNQALFDASLKELHGEHWDNAVAGFERLTTTLPARDPLLPESYFYLGQAHEGKNEFILAAQAYSRLPEAFPEDTLADDATYQAGISYSRLWKRPSLDAEYGETALSTFTSFMVAYPDSPLRDSAQKQINKLNEWFAKKSYDTGKLYQRRKAYDSAIIYYKYVVQQYAQTQHAKSALIGLVQSYRAIKYREEMAETCATLNSKYPGDGDVHSECPAEKQPATPIATPAQQAPAPATPAQTPEQRTAAPSQGAPPLERAGTTPP
ncbi:MAG TPA: outer membrane protein assembly factor BamD [Gemmatimonadaceae bacterium]|nr:outer membrane protein assembly factor BamD [Gemmatimonadaceae bacterium]